MNMKVVHIRAGMGVCHESQVHVTKKNFGLMNISQFEEDAMILAKWLRSSVPGGTVDRLPGALDKLRTEQARKIRQAQEAGWIKRKLEEESRWEGLERDD
jgi:hypothetical protein